MVSNGDIEKSILEYDKGIEYVQQGFVDKAAAFFLSAVRLNPGFVHAYYLLAMNRTFHPDDRLIPHYQSLIHSAHVSDADRVVLHFALAKIYQDLNLPDQVLSQVRLAHAHSPCTLAWEKQLAKVNRLIRAFPQALFAKRQADGRRDVSPVFLMGLPQSGIEQVEAALNQCQGALSIREGGGIQALIQTLDLATQGEQRYPDNVKALDFESTQQLANGYLTYLEQHTTAGIEVVIDTACEYIEHLGLISLLFPQAKILLCHRDPLETCLAQYCQPPPPDGTETQDLTHLGMLFQAYVKLVRHWMASLPVTLQVMQVQYEDWISEPDAIPQLLAFCGLDTVQAVCTPDSVRVFEQAGWGAAYVDWVPELVALLSLPDARAVAYEQAALRQYEAGAYEQSQRYLRRALKQEETLTAVYPALFRQQRFTEEAGDVSAAQACLAALDLTPEQQANCQFALAKAYEDLAFDTQAFAVCEQANAATCVAFDETAWAQHIDDIITAFHETHWQKCRDWAHHTAAPIFVFGLPGSGLSWVEHRLASHPSVQAVNEHTMMQRLATGLPHITQAEQAYPQCLSALSAEVVEQLAQTYLETLEAQVSGPVVQLLEKNATHFLHLGLLAMMFPQAKFIHCRRHPMETCLSCYFQPPSASGYAVYAYDLPALGRYYHHYQRLMDHWHTVLPVSIYAMEYEQWVHQPIQASRQLLDFCGLSWQPECEQSHLSQRRIVGNHAWQVRQPVYQSPSRRARYSAHLAALSQGL